jgi:glutamine amidotransferase
MRSSMCRLLGIVASEPTEFRLALREAPRSLAHLSREHRDGWGMAVWDDASDGTSAPEARRGQHQGGWRLDKGVACAHEDQRFHELALRRGELLVAHIRQRTVGCSSIENTHPFASGRWVFAHNGTVKDVDFLRARVSAARAREVRGQTDSELLFAFFLTRLDEAGVTEEEADAVTDRVIKEAVREARAHANFGSYNFLLSDAKGMYAHRFGRSLFLLERGPHDAVRVQRESSEGVVVQTPWSQRRHAVLVASERLTDEPWEELPEGMLLRIDRTPLPRWRLVDALAA